MPTVEAIRGCEERVRLTLAERLATKTSTVEHAELEEEFFRLCAEVRTLVDQARAEGELLHG